MAKRRKKKPAAEQILFARTFVETDEIRIYLNPKLKGCMGETTVDGSRSLPWIEFPPQAFEDPERFEEYLVHEFVHVLEALMAFMLRQEDPKDCTQLAIVIGRYLPRMLRNLEVLENASDLPELTEDSVLKWKKAR